MRGLLSEYLVKGIFLGLLLFVALQEPDWPTTGKVAALAVGGLVVALGVAAWRKWREGYRARGRPAAFLLFLLLESPGLVYAGILIGMVAGAYAVRTPDSDSWLATVVAGGAALGVVFWLLRHVANRMGRIALSLGLGAALVAGALYWHYENPERLQDPAAQTMFAVRLLLGLPLFYLLTFAGITEESEVEIGAICAALGLACWTLAQPSPSAQSLGLLIPALLYLAYTMRILPGLRVFKYVIRGLSHANIGRYRAALATLRRALQLDPTNKLARETLWSLHRKMDLGQVLQDPQTLAMMDFDLCLERASSLLLQPSPGPEKLQEAHRLLDLVVNQRPAARPVVDYWKAVAYTHARQYDQAAEALEHVVDRNDYPPKDPDRESVLFSAWQLALLLHPEMNRRVGTPQLAVAGRRLEAIGAVERRLAAQPEDAAAWDLKRLLYAGLTEADYQAAQPEGASADFDHAYARQLGQALIGDSARWQRGVEYLRLAARGLPAEAPTIFLQIAEAYQREGQPDAVWPYYELAQRAGQAVGAKNLGDADQQAYFTAVKLLADHARAAGDLDAAITNYHLYTESARSGLETLRILTDLYEAKKNVFGALYVTEQALIYDPKDKDLLARKDRYYYSIMPDELRTRLESIRAAFDVEYCLRKAKSLLDYKDADLDLVDWALHLAELAQVVKPESIVAKVQRARARRRKGEIDESRALLEEVFTNKPERFDASADEDAWYLACRLLGEAYLYEAGRPDLAIPCFNAYRKSSKSGADTIYKLGQAYEQIGDRVRAAKCYENVTSYESHPLAPEAREGLARVRTG